MGRRRGELPEDIRENEEEERIEPRTQRAVEEEKTEEKGIKRED